MTNKLKFLFLKIQGILKINSEDHEVLSITTCDNKVNNNTTVVFSNDIKLDGDDEFIKAFNRCSDLWARTDDPNLSQEERISAIDEWQQSRMRLEQGYYN